MKTTYMNLAIVYFLATEKPLKSLYLDFLIFNFVFWRYTRQRKEGSTPYYGHSEPAPTSAPSRMDDM